MNFTKATLLMRSTGRDSIRISETAYRNYRATAQARGGGISE